MLNNHCHQVTTQLQLINIIIIIIINTGQTSMPPVGFEPTISAGERPQTYALNRAATGTGQL